MTRRTTTTTGEEIGRITRGAGLADSATKAMAAESADAGGAKKREASRSAPAVQRRWLTLDEASAFYGCHRETMRHHIARGYVRAYRLGKGPKAPIRIALEDLEKLLQPIPSAGQRSA